MKVFDNVKSVANDFISLFYPDLCLVCSVNLLKKEECICTSCLFQIPKTDCFKNSENRVSKLFWGRVQLKHAVSLYEFNKDGGAQKLIHQLKYEGNKKAGVFLGKQLAYAIQDADNFKQIDCIVPVPLHPKKEKLRGYNQSKYIVNGINEILQVKINTRSLIRVENTDSQTRKKRFSRWENMMNSFIIKHPLELNNTHILLIDDVVTTGATLEACAQKLLEIEGVTVSVATIAVA